MRIAVYSHYFAPEVGAPSARILEHARCWVALGHDVQVITCFPNHPGGKLYPGFEGGLYHRADLDGITVHRQWTYVTPNRGFVKKTIGHVSFLPSAALISRRRLDPFDVAIGTSPTFFAAMAAAGGARRRGVPFVMEVRDLWPAIFVELGVIKNRLAIAALERLELRLYRQAARVVTVTEPFRQNLIERGVPAWKVHTIPNGADMDFWKPIPSAPAAARPHAGKFLVLYIGAHGISQGLATILAAADQLRSRDDIHFLLVGDGADKDRLVRDAEQRRLANVSFEPSVGKEQVREYYARANACLVPLRAIPLFDTFIPSKMFEILAMGRPIVASVRGESARILNASGGALVSAPDDPAAIAANVERLAADPTLGQKLGAAGRAFVAMEYARPVLARRFEHTLREAVEHGRQPPT